MLQGCITHLSLNVTVHLGPQCVQNHRVGLERFLMWCLNSELTKPEICSSGHNSSAKSWVCLRD